MKKLLLVFSIFMSVIQFAFTQNALPNPGFEDWTTTGTYENPDGWTTANSYSTLVGVQLTTKATAPADIHSGNFAMKTETVFIGALPTSPSQVWLLRVTCK